MKLRWIAAAAGLALMLRASSRGEQGKSATPQMRRQFARIARLRLVAACPGLDGRLRERALRDTFDWIIAEMCRRTGSSDFAELVRWARREGQVRTDDVSAEVTLEAVNHLPAAALRLIEGCQGRLFAAVLLQESLREAGRRSLPELNRYAAFAAAG